MKRIWKTKRTAFTVLVLGLMVITGGTAFARGVPEAGPREGYAVRPGPGPGHHRGVRPESIGSYDERITREVAEGAIIDTLNHFGYDTDLEIVEMTDFEYSFYAQIGERETGTIAIELLVDPYTGHVRPVPGGMHHGPAGYGFRNDPSGRFDRSGWSGRWDQSRRWDRSSRPDQSSRWDGPDRSGRFEREEFPDGDVDEDR
jgi:hypothetical protein